MTILIKSNDAARAANVRLLGPRTSGVSRPPEPWIDPELVTLRAEVERLHGELAEQNATILGHEEGLKAAYGKGEAAGRMVGRKEADDGRSALSSRLESTAKAALQQFSDELSSLERLAALLAIAGVEKILGESGDRAEQMLQLVRNQVQGLQAEAIVRVEVSQADFPESEQLDDLETALGAGVEMRAVAELRSGDCRIKLQLGAIEVGVDQQWGRLRELLAELSEPKAAT